MARFTVAMNRRLGELEREYDVAPQEEEESGLFGPRGFLGNIKDYYQPQQGWGDWWRGLFGGERERRETPQRDNYTVYPEWGRQNINTLREIMREN